MECSSPDGAEGWGASECWDGRTCRTELARAGCPPTYYDAPEGSPFDGVDCAAPTTEGFVYVYQDFATHICAYDSDGRLFASEYVDDNDEHCGERTEIVVAGEPLPVQFVLTDFDRYGGCTLSGSAFLASSPSEVFTTRFPLKTAGHPCVAASDGCRSSILLLVCREGVDESEAGSCDVCTTDEECSAEYWYIEPNSLRCVSGSCRFDERPLGSCDDGQSLPHCRIAGTSVSYVCRSGVCSACIDDGRDCSFTQNQICYADSTCH